MLKVGLGEKKKKERKKDKKHTNSIARIRARASRPAVSLACLKLHQAANKTKYKTHSISEYTYNGLNERVGKSVIWVGERA